MMINRSFSLIFVLVILLACNTRKEKIVLYYSVNEPMGQIALTIREILETHLDLRVETVIGEGSLADVDNLTGNKAHLALVENHIGFRAGVKSMLPVYPQILHVFYRADRESSDLAEILNQQHVFIGHEGDGSHFFAMNLFNHFNIDTSTFTLTENPFNADVLFGFSDIIADHDLVGLMDYRLFGFDAVSRKGLGSKVEGMTLKFPKIRPFIIPEGTYGTLTQKPLLTVASDVLLVTNDQMDDDLVYEITKTIFRNLQEFNHISPLISQDLNEDFDRAALSFPLHNGARIYLDRDEPTFAERYAELAGVIFSVLLALTSAFYSLGKWTHQRKKDRVDVFYVNLMKIKRVIHKMNDLNQIRKMISKVKSDQETAFNMLVDEKLEANESFRIYMELSKETLQELRRKKESTSEMSSRLHSGKTNLSNTKHVSPGLRNHKGIPFSL